jgi:hypothetical protein
MQHNIIREGQVYRGREAWTTNQSSVDCTKPRIFGWTRGTSEVISSDAKSNQVPMAYQWPCISISLQQLAAAFILKDGDG